MKVDILAVFPEGKTSDGNTLLPFHGNLIQAAITTDTPVQPVALRFLDLESGSTNTAASYIGDKSLVASIWRTLSQRDLRASVVFGSPQLAEGRDRRTWAGVCARRLFQCAGCSGIE